ncbi:MAG TPA: copper chaperone PCu(A)C [Burkholderiales bacterium]|nr:copper chaperone PCu(A)C [Burkholderiales bacterium]
MRILAFALLLVATAADAQVEIDKAWARATAPGAPVAGGYMTIRNKGGAPDRLVGASSAAAARVELHVHIKEGEVMKMRQVSAYEVPAKGSFELKPGGAHLMFVQIARPFKEGDKIPVKLKFEKAGEVSVEFAVGRLGDTAPPAHKH